MAEVRFAQKGISEVFRYGEFAGRTIDDVATGLQAGIIAPSQLPIQVIERGGGLYTLNNRSLMALRLAGVVPTIIRFLDRRARRSRAPNYNLSLLRFWWNMTMRVMTVSLNGLG